MPTHIVPRLGSDPLRLAPAYRPPVRRASVREEEQRESVRGGAAGRRSDAVLPVVPGLDSQRGVGGAQEERVEPGAVPPAFDGGVGEDDAVEGRGGKGG